MDTIRFGICGTGSFGRTRARALQKAHGTVVTLGWSRTRRTRDLFRQELDVPTVEHWQDLCASADVDAVLVCSTNVDHFTHARGALAAGKHVLVEIPLSASAAQAKELAQLAASKVLVLHHGIQTRHHPEYRAHIDQIRRIGPLLYGIEHSHWDFGAHRKWNANPDLNAGGRDFIAYYMPRWMDAFGEVERVTGAQSRADGWSSASITMNFSAGRYFTVGYTLGESVWPEKPELIIGRDGMICQDDDVQALVTADARQTLALSKIDGVQCEIEAFRDEILGLRDHLTPLQTDLRALDLVDIAIPSA